MKLCLYANFNNYYNRKVIKYDTLAEYQDKLLFIIDNVNFRPNDGINTEAIIKTSQIVSNEPFYIETIPDYLMAVDDDGTIVSRWFIMEYTSIIVGVQYKAVLRRDLIADNFEDIIDAPMFIEKATITDKEDSAIFNNENMSFNQIKKSETPLYDIYDDCPWIVGYIPSNVNWAYDDDSNPRPNIVGEYNHVKYVLGSGGTLTQSSSCPLVDSMPFKMFCMPYGTKTFINTDGGTEEFTTAPGPTLACAEAITPILGTEMVYDIQILPYCPIRDYLTIKPNGKIDFTTYLYQTGRVYQQGHEGVDEYCKGIIFWCPTNKFSFNIPYHLPLPDTALEMKVKNETEMYRLCSPNYSGQFEFSPMKNNGVTKFNVDCMYQPYNPYIHINPDFKGLYGDDFDDCRGLIVNGDFSLPSERNSWAEYQLNNKNFQQIFDRQIQNMERNNSYQMISQIASAASGTIQGGAQGKYWLGGTGGAITGGAFSLGAGIVDTIMLREQQKETLDYTKDQFGYQLGNIRALPNSISKTSPFTNNNKLFPVVEKYSCTDIEKEALENKLKYDGMTIGRVGKINDWLLDDYSYIKGKLIMIDTLEEEYHTVVEIAQELDKGIRAKRKEA